MTYTDQSPILAAVTIPPIRQYTITRTIIERPHGTYSLYDVGSIIGTYASLCATVGIDPVLAIAQMILETANLSSFWAQRPRRNPAGIGVTGEYVTSVFNSSNYQFNPVTKLYAYGVAFPSWTNDAIPAHVGRLLCYAIPVGAGTPQQTILMTKATSYRAFPLVLRGSATILRQLGTAYNPKSQGWATPGLDYGEKIAEIANTL